MKIPKKKIAVDVTSKHTKTKDCPVCRGSLKMPDHLRNMFDPPLPVGTQCYECRGTGKVADHG